MTREGGRREGIAQRIQDRVVPENRGYIVNGKVSLCHIWTGPDSGDGRGGGYGRMSLNGQTVAVHIVSYTNAHGYVPSKKQIDHLCNQRSCCNPDHLELVTHKRNQRRRDAAMRMASKMIVGSAMIKPCRDCNAPPKISKDNEGWTILHCCRSISRAAMPRTSIRYWNDLQAAPI